MRLFSAFAALCAAALILAGCASDPRQAWMQQTEAYSSITETAVTLREPCLSLGASHPTCILGDEAWAKFRAVQGTADGYLKAVDRELTACETADDDLPLADQVGLGCEDGAAARLLKRARETLLALAAFLPQK